MAKAQGKHLGRVVKSLPDEFNAVYERLQNRELTYNSAAAALHVTEGQFRGMLHKYRYGKKCNNTLIRSVILHHLERIKQHLRNAGSDETALETPACFTYKGGKLIFM